MIDLRSGERFNATTSQLATIENPHETALVLFAHVLDKPKTWVIAHPEVVLTSEQTRSLDEWVHRILGGEPLPYLLGHQEFYNLEFYVTPDVLIPRPETEKLVHLALKWLRARLHFSHGLDVGTGSGCIPISLLKNFDLLRMTAVDISQPALEVAAVNMKFHKVEDRLLLAQSDLFENVLGSFDLVTANLPYIPTEKIKEVNSLAFEPKLALDGGSDGLMVMRRFLEQVTQHLQPTGLLLLEIESSLGAQTIQLVKSFLPSFTVDLHNDDAGLNRIVTAEGQTHA